MKLIMSKVAKVFVANVIPPMLATKERMDAEIMEISIPQSGAERHTNEVKWVMQITLPQHSLNQ